MGSSRRSISPGLPLAGCWLWETSGGSGRLVGAGMVGAFLTRGEYRASLAPSFPILSVVQPTVARQAATCNLSLHVSRVRGASLASTQVRGRAVGASGPITKEALVGTGLGFRACGPVGPILRGGQDDWRNGDVRV